MQQPKWLPKRKNRYTETEGVEQRFSEPEATTEPATEDTTVRMSKDWTNDATQMNLLIASLVYKEAGAEAPVQVLAARMRQVRTELILQL